MEIGEHKYWKEESRYFIKHNDVNYIRNECKMLNDFHTIKWNIEIEDGSKRQDGPLHYYSYPQGWDDETGHLNINQLPPILEIEFKKCKI